MPITLNHSNIGVQYNTGSNYIIETVKSDLYIGNESYNTIVSNNLQTAPVTPTNIYLENTSNIYAVESYTYTGSANTADYTRVFPNNTVCDILVVGGGGSGSEAHGGGGGAGAVIFMKNVTMNGNYTIKVGKGGVCEVTSGVDGKGRKGNDTEIFTTNNINNKIVAEGGGGGGQLANANGGSGGSGGGGDAHSIRGNGGTATAYTPILDGVTGIKYGNNGGNAFGTPGHGGGGGGAGGAGENALAAHNSGNSENERAHGGVGIKSATINSINYDFKTLFGTNSGGVLEADGFLYFGGGGGNGRWSDTSDNEGGKGGLGGGGKGGWGTASAQIAELNGAGYPGINGTGGGGGGGGDNKPAGGSGGSGIVIIRYLVGTIPSNNFLTAEPTVISPAMTESIRTFIHSGGTEAQTTHTITVGQNTICDILIVGGGGGGSAGHGGGGGAGQLVLINNAILSGTYTIKVGKGGNGSTLSGTSQTMGTLTNGTKGSNSEFGNASINVIAEGGGISVDTTLRNGGSGAGGDGHTPDGGVGGKGSKNTTVDTFSSGTVYSRGNDGGDGAYATSTNAGQGGGGGGAGSAGTTGGQLNDSAIGHGGDGLSGISQINYDFKTNFGNYGKLESDGNYWFAGGGAGGTYYINSSVVSNGGKGGGGSTPASANNTKINGGVGMNGTGGGGAGGTAWYGNGGNGGSGIVIIKFKTIVNAAISEGNPITHKRLNFVYEPRYPSISVDNTNLKAWYKFDGNYNDSSGSGFNLTNSGAVIVDGLIVQSVSFPNSASSLSTSGINLNSKTYSICFWAKLNTTHANSGSERWYWSQSISGGVGTFVGFQYQLGGDKLRFTHYGSGNDIDTPTGMSAIIGLNWNHYVITYNDTTKGVEIWLNSVKLVTSPATMATRFTGSGDFKIGTSILNNINFNGLMEDFRYYDKVLTSTEISQLYNIPTQNTYTLNFPVPTIADINNNSNIVLRGAYDIALSSTNSAIIPKEGQYIPRPTTFTTSNLSLRYHLLNPTLDPIGAQWTYSSNNTNVYHMGRVGIGTTNPEYQLDVRGFIFTSAGGYTQTGSENWVVQSDRRIKENIVKASYEKCLDNVKKIELYNFNFKDNCVNTNDKNQLGFIAQEVQQVYPKAVEVGRMTLDNNQGINDLLTLNTTQIKYTLYGAVKNLIERVENIESRVEQIYNMTLSSNIKSSSSNISITFITPLTPLTPNITTNTSNITTNTSNVSRTSNITTNTSNITTNTSNITTNTSNI